MLSCNAWSAEQPQSRAGGAAIDGPRISNVTWRRSRSRLAACRAIKMASADT